MRSGSFDRGVQVGEWTTCDKAWKVYKVTKMKARATTAPARAFQVLEEAYPAPMM